MLWRTEEVLDPFLRWQADATGGRPAKGSSPERRHTAPGSHSSWLNVFDDWERLRPTDFQAQVLGLFTKHNRAEFLKWGVCTLKVSLITVSLWSAVGGARRKQ